MKRSIRSSAAIAGLVIAFGLLLLGFRTSQKIYEPGEDEFGIQVFHKIPDRDLVIDATFSGVLREDGRLVTTYDRSQGVGKRACPT